MNEKRDDEKTDPNLVLPKAMLAPQPQAAVPPIETPQVTVKLPEMGILAPLMKDPEISEIMVNDVRNVMIEKNGQMYVAGTHFTSIDDLNRLTRAILDVTGRILSPDSPYVDTMLPDGSRVNIVGPPLTQHGPCLTIRKFPTRRFTLDDLMAHEFLDRRMAYLLQACVLGRLNIVVSGGTSSGKTTLLNALLMTISKNERIIAVEDTSELIVQQINSVKLQTKPQMPASAAITARELVANALRMRPDRIIVGECRRAEAFDMLQAMNTGHSGSMTSVHANSPRDALARLETLSLLSGIDLPSRTIKRQMVDAIDVLVHTQRFRDGRRKVTAITEVIGMEGETITTQEIFTCSNDGTQFKCSGFVPAFLDRLEDAGIVLPAGFFA